jgi:hypothetical protein
MITTLINDNTTLSRFEYGVNPYIGRSFKNHNKIIIGEAF